VPIPRSRNGSVRARHEHQKAIGCRVVVPPHSRKQEKKKAKKNRTRGFVRRPTLPFDARAGEATFATRVLLRDVDAENIFKIARVACARFLANSGEKRERTKEKREEKRRRDKKERQNNKKGRQELPPLFCLFVCLESSPSKREFCLSRRRRRRSKKKETKFFVSSRKQTSHHFFLYQKKPPTREDRPFKSASFLPRFLPL